MAGRLAAYRWVDTRQQLADMLTKTSVDWYFRWAMEHGRAMYSEDPELEQKISRSR